MKTPDRFCFFQLFSKAGFVPQQPKKSEAVFGRGADANMVDGEGFSAVERRGLVLGFGAVQLMDVVA